VLLLALGNGAQHITGLGNVRQIDFRADFVFVARWTSFTAARLAFVVRPHELAHALGFVGLD
jgi:hypothetical protein